MCVAGLNVSTQACEHRWYQLVRPCDTGMDLARCQGKLRLEGWETRGEGCPWCDGSSAAISQSTHRLIGSAACGSPTVSSPTSPILHGFSAFPSRQHRSGSGSTLSSLSRRNSSSSSDSERGQKHREMNQRLHLYLTTSPFEVLPSAQKYYSSDATMSPLESPDSDVSSINPGRGGRSWMKSVKISKSLFRP